MESFYEKLKEGHVRVVTEEQDEMTIQERQRANNLESLRRRDACIDRERPVFQDTVTMLEGFFGQFAEDTGIAFEVVHGVPKRPRMFGTSTVMLKDVKINNYPYMAGYSERRARLKESLAWVAEVDVCTAIITDARTFGDGELWEDDARTRLSVVLRCYPTGVNGAEDRVVAFRLSEPVAPFEIDHDQLREVISFGVLACREFLFGLHHAYVYAEGEVAPRMDAALRWAVDEGPAIIAKLGTANVGTLFPSCKESELVGAHDGQ